MWSSEMRGFVSVLLLIHLLALALIFWSNNDRSDQRQAEVVSRAKRVLNLYLYPFWLDRTWDNRLAGSDPLDADHAFVVNVGSPNGKPFERRFPLDDGVNPEERERWQRAARLVAYRNADDPNTADQLVLELAKGCRKQIEGANADSELKYLVNQIKIECRRRIRQTVDDDSANPALDREEVAYVATVKWAPNGEAFLTKPAAEARDVSPVVPKGTGILPPQAPGANGLPLPLLPGQTPSPQIFPVDPALIPARPAPAPGAVPTLPEVR